MCAHIRRVGSTITPPGLGGRVEINNSVMCCPVVLKFGTLVHSKSCEKSTSNQIQDGRLRPNVQSFNRYNSAVDCPTLRKRDRLVHYETAEPTT